MAIPLHVVFLGGVLAFFPALLAAAIGVDVLRARHRGPRPWPTTRLAVFTAFAGVANLLALAAAPLVAVAPRRRRWAFAACNLFVRAVISAASWIYGWRLSLEGREALEGGGRLLVLARHVSTAETLLPILLLQARHGIPLRYVLKSELRWISPIDLYGGWMGYAFVRRDAEGKRQALHSLTVLGAHMPPDSGVVIYPEGTRWTPEKADQRREELAAQGPSPDLELARELRALLPPKAGGTQALRAAAPDADVLLYAHTGFENGATLGDVWDGGWIDLRIRVRFERAPAARVPEAPDEVEVWLREVWRRLDRWVVASLEGTS